MRNPKGYAAITGPSHRDIEWDFFVCRHCQACVQVKPFCDAADAGGRCLVCDSLICKGCLTKSCLPFEKKIEAMEARARFRSMI